jgi:signal-transduction protein with cAMP-binding, CBS, and nucleotidyltransferase domain
MNCHCEQNMPSGMAVSPKCVQDIWLFSEFDAEDMAVLASVGRRKVFRRGEAVFHQGAPANALFLIKSGRVKLSKTFADGREITLDYRKAGDTFGENMFIEEGCYPVAAWAIEENVHLRHQKVGFRAGDSGASRHWSAGDTKAERTDCIPDHSAG